MSKKIKAEMLMVYFTGAMAIFTAWMAYETFDLARESREASIRQIGVQTWLEFEKRFDAPDMIKARRVLAIQLKAHAKEEDMSEKVPDFFEDLGEVYYLGYIDEKLAKSSFGLYATRYWAGLRSFTDKARRRYGADSTIYTNFEYLSKEMLERGEKIDENQLQQLLDDESTLSDN